MARTFDTDILVLSTAPTQAGHVTRKDYVDGQIALMLPLTGGTLTGSLTLAADPTAGLQAATKQYVDNVSQGLQAKNSVQTVATFGVVLHWSAGPYMAVFNAYHYCLVWDAARGQMHVAKTLKLSQLGQHAYRFNHHRIGISWMAMRSCVPGDLGPCPITPAFLDAGARFVAEFMAWHQLDPSREFNLAAGGPWPALLDHDQVDHIVGRNEKWDLRPYRTELFAAVRSHFAALKAGHQEFGYKGILTDAAS